MAQKTELESKMNECKSAADFAELAIEASQESADLDFAKDLLKKAEGISGLPADYIKTAEAYFKIFNDKDKAGELYEEAEDACFEPMETAELGHSIAVTLGDKDKAKDLLETAASQAAKVPELMIIAGYVSLDLGDETLAKSLIEKVEVGIKTYDDFLNATNTLLEQGNRETAKSIFRKALNKISDIVDVVKYAKTVKDLFDDNEWAKEALEEVVDDAQFTNEFVMLAEVYHELGDEDKADELIEQGSDFAIQGEEHITLAKVFMNVKKNAEKAREFFEKGLKDIRDKQQLIDYAKDIAVKMEDRELAMQFFKQAESKAVALKDYLHLAAEVKDSTNDIDYIDSIYTLAEEKAESFDDLKTLAANILEKLEKREKALGVYEKVLKSVQKIQQYFELLKECVNKLEDNDFARRILDDAYAKAETSPELIKIGEAVIKYLDDKEYAKQILERAEEIVTTLDELKAVDAIVKQHYGDDAEWLKRLEEKLEKREKNQVVYDEFQQREKAISTFKELLQLNQDMMAVLDDFYYSKKLLTMAESMLINEFFNFDKYKNLIEAIHTYLKNEEWIKNIIEMAYTERVQFVFELDAVCRAALNYLSDKKQAEMLVMKFTEDFEKRLDESPANDAYDYVKLANIVFNLSNDKEYADSIFEKAIRDADNPGMRAAVGIAYYKFAYEDKANECFGNAFGMCNSSDEIVATAQLMLNGGVDNSKVKEYYLQYKPKSGTERAIIPWIAGLVELFDDSTAAEKEYAIASKKLSGGDLELLIFNKKVMLGEEVF
jgi:tetratricopeptide (TPR) repeat protein